MPRATLGYTQAPEAALTTQAAGVGAWGWGLRARAGRCVLVGEAGVGEAAVASMASSLLAAAVGRNASSRAKAGLGEATSHGGGDGEGAGEARASSQPTPHRRGAPIPGSGLSPRQGRIHSPNKLSAARFNPIRLTVSGNVPTERIWGTSTASETTCSPQRTPPGAAPRPTPVGKQLNSSPPFGTGKTGGGLAKCRR